MPLHFDRGGLAGGATGGFAGGFAGGFDGGFPSGLEGAALGLLGRPILTRALRSHSNQHLNPGIKCNELTQVPARQEGRVAERV